MEWQQILGFHRIAHLGSFTKAAEATFRTQSALTQQIRSLERELDCELFERIGKRRLKLTPAGEKFLAFAEGVLASRERLVQEINEARGIHRGTLRIGAPFTTLFHLLPEVIQSYTRRWPDVELSLLDRSQQDVVNLVKKGDIDFGIVLEAMVPGDLRSVRWVTVRSVLMVPRGHPLVGQEKVSAKQMARYPLILPPRAGRRSRRSLLESLFRRHGIGFRIVMESSNVELSAVYVERGLGISFATITEGLTGLRRRKLAFVPLDHYFKPAYIAVIMRKNRKLTQAQAAFIETLTEIRPSGGSGSKKSTTCRT
ncbi:MAG: LysR family transcriptional regulator [Nitrospiraceae bacterium]|nr:LysR family transcriptional regulator [Nitrospiraceae bacterium]